MRALAIGIFLPYSLVHQRPRVALIIREATQFQSKFFRSSQVELANALKVEGV